VNIIFPLVRSLLPQLYFRDPQVYIQPLQRWIEKKEITEYDIPNELTGDIEQVELPARNGDGSMRIIKYDAAKSAKILQGTLNQNIKKAKLKNNIKDSLLDALTMFYGVIFTGFNHEQGVPGMGELEFDSVREDVMDNLCYGIRMKPWDVLVDPHDFYNPSWIALKFIVPIEQLKEDTRLQFTNELTGMTKYSEEMKHISYAYFDDDELKYVTYYAIFEKPSARVKGGFYGLFTEEIKDRFMYDNTWPYQKAKDFPIKFIYFNKDPLGGLPIPLIRFVAQQQKAKNNMRNAWYQYIQRTVPFVLLSKQGIDDADLEQLKSGIPPRIVLSSAGDISNKVTSQSYNNLNQDFFRLEKQITDDVSVTMGQYQGVYPGSGEGVDFATSANLSNNQAAILQSERGDLMAEFMLSVLEQWTAYLKEFAGKVNWTRIDGEEYPIEWSSDEIQGNFEFLIKPFSMQYEDPVLIRRQKVDILNLLSAAPVQMALAKEGAVFKLAPLVKSVLDSFNDISIETAIEYKENSPEAKVLGAIEENRALESNDINVTVMVTVEPTDNDPLHILIHQEGVNKLLQMGSDINDPRILEYQNHIQKHYMKMEQAMPEKSGGGNAAS